MNLYKKYKGPPTVVWSAKEKMLVGGLVNSIRVNESIIAYS